MAIRVPRWHSLTRSVTKLASQPRCITLSRPFSSTRLQRTDGVFRALTENRVQTPWIEAFERQQKDGHDPTKPSGPALDRDLTPKRMSDSFHKVVLPLGQDKWLLDTYLNSSGHVRFGTIFMDLDALSGVIAYKHTGDTVTTVTAACDRIKVNHPLTEICDLEYSGMVTYATGRSSMEVSVQVAKAPKPGEQAKEEDVLITCQFTMVSLDTNTKKPCKIPPIIAETAEEKRLYAEGEKNSQHRKDILGRSLVKETPNDEESDLIHAMWQRQLQYHDPNDPLRKPDNVQFMDATKIATAAIMQPQYRNRHHFMIFGGFLLKQTFELAFCCAASFAHTRPVFVSLDPSTFQNPVPVGSVLYLTAHVVYTDPPVVAGGSDDPVSDSEHVTKDNLTRVQIRVDTKVRNIEHGEVKPTGQFNYTFTVDRSVQVLPRTYTEFMMYVDARRRARTIKQTLIEGDGDPGKQERVTE